MHSINPYLRAFFKSNIPAQCNPVNHHILLAPTTECLLTARDGEANAAYADVASSEDFLASHVIRIPSPRGPAEGSVRDSKGKAKQYNTINGRTVVIKESFVYSNKGKDINSGFSNPLLKTKQVSRTSIKRNSSQTQSCILIVLIRINGYCIISQDLSSVRTNLSQLRQPSFQMRWRASDPQIESQNCRPKRVSQPHHLRAREMSKHSMTYSMAFL